ncbi:hypothetical protein GCM10022268_14740 [Sphingomonas cynarae]|uniref:Uncharacterized protein n=1 Tax=Sphingomonas cynarae TaxID=930197 RepID=A0ABP7DJX1_9SPHN
MLYQLGGSSPVGRNAPGKGPHRSRTVQPWSPTLTFDNIRLTGIPVYTYDGNAPDDRRDRWIGDRAVIGWLSGATAFAPHRPADPPDRPGTGATIPQPTIGRQVDRIEDDIRPDRAGGWLTRKETRQLRRKNGVIGDIASRHATDGVSLARHASCRPAPR